MSTAAPQIIDPVKEAEEAAFKAIKNFLSGSAALGGDEAINKDLALLDSGILDSLGVVQLVTFLSEKLGVEVQDDDFIAENFETVGSLARFVAKKQLLKTG